MNGSIGDYSTKKISKALIEEIKSSLRGVTSHGSVEIYVQDSIVTQITVRSIKKTNNKNGHSNTGKSIVNKL